MLERAWRSVGAFAIGMWGCERGAGGVAHANEDGHGRAAFFLQDYITPP